MWFGLQHIGRVAFGFHRSDRCRADVLQFFKPFFNKFLLIGAPDLASSQGATKIVNNGILVGLGYSPVVVKFSCRNCVRMQPGRHDLQAHVPLLKKAWTETGIESQTFFQKKRPVKSKEETRYIMGSNRLAKISFFIITHNPKILEVYNGALAFSNANRKCSSCSIAATLT